MSEIVDYTNLDENIKIILSKNQVSNVRELIYDLSKKTSLLPESIVLKYNNITLEDGQCFNDYEIKDKSKIKMYLRVKVQNVDNIEHLFVMKTDDLIRHLKRKYCQATNCAEIVLTCRRPCPDTRFIKHYLRNNSCIFTAYKSIIVTIINKNGQSYSILAFENDTISKIKLELMKRNIINNNNEILMMRNTVLMEELELLKYKIIEPIFVGFRILIRIKGRILYHFKVNTQTEISTIKRYLGKKINLDANMISLLLGSKNLNNNKTVEFYKINEKYVLYMEVNCKIMINFSEQEKIIKYFRPNGLKIKNIKENLCKKYKICENKSYITLNNEELSDDCLIESLKLESESILHLEIKENNTNSSSVNVENNEDKITLKIINENKSTEENGDIFIMVDPLCSVEQLRKVISRELEISLCNINIFYHKKVLLDNNINYYGITNNDSLTLKPLKNLRNPDEPFIIKVRNEDDQIEQYMIDNFETIGILKNILRDQKNVNVESIKLFFNNNELKDEDNIKELIIESGSLITLIIEEKRKDDKEKINITVRNSRNDDFRQLSVFDDDKINFLKCKLETEFNLSSKDCVISFRGVILKEDNKINTYNIREGDEIVISQSLLVRYFVSHDNNSARVHRYPFIPKDKVSDLYLKIIKKINIEPRFIHLNYNGRVLDEEDDLEEIGIENNSYIVMTAFLAGGCYSYIQY